MNPYANIDYYSIYGDICIIEGIPFLRRQIGGNLYDLASVYPFTYENIEDICILLNKIDTDPNCISLTLVTNPIGKQPKKIAGWDYYWFQYCSEFKTHQVINLTSASPDNYSKDKQRNLKKFYKKGNEGIVEVVPQKAITDRLIENCFKAYKKLEEKHSIKEDAASHFTEEQFRRQFFVEDSILIIARDSLSFGGWALFHRRANNVYYHLSASSPHGYKIGSSYAILDTAIGLFKQLGFHYFMLGSGAGVDSNPNLEYFKSGWGTFQQKNYIYGWINNPKMYRELCKDKDPNKKYFPLYRS